MSNQRKLKPVEGRLVRHPGEDKRPLDPQGEVVEFTTYWRRKLNAGDVVEVPAEQPAPAAKGGAK